MRSALTCAVCATVATALPEIAGEAGAIAVFAGLSDAAAGNAFYDAVRPLAESIADWFGKEAPKAGDPILEALRAAHLVALGDVLAAFQVELGAMTANEQRAAAPFVANLGGFLVAARGGAVTGGNWWARSRPGQSPQGAALFAPLPDALQIALADREAPAADAVSESLLDEVLDLTGIARADMPARFAAIFAGERGWFSRFATHSAEALAKTDAFKSLWNAVQIAQIRASLAEFGVALGRIEAKLETMEEAAERRHREVMAEIAREKGVPPEHLAPILERMGHAQVPLADMARVLGEAVDRLLARGLELTQVHNDAPLMDQAIREARAKLATLDTDGAKATLQAALSAEDAAWTDQVASRNRARARGLFELAFIQRTSFDYAGARASLEAGLTLDPDEAWRWGELGDLCMTTGDLTCAGAAFAAARNATERALAKAPEDTKVLSHLSVSHTKIGDQEIASGNLTAALVNYSESENIVRRLFITGSNNPSLFRLLSVVNVKMGDLQNQFGEHTTAIDMYNSALLILSAFSTQDPKNEGLKRDIGSIQNKIGDVYFDHEKFDSAFRSYSEAFRILFPLAVRQRGNVLAQSELASTYERFGDVYTKKENLILARKNFLKSLNIRRVSSKQDRNNLKFQHDLSVSHHKLGDVERALGNTEFALSNYKIAFDIDSRLADHDPTNAAWQKALMVSCVKIAQTDHRVAREKFEQALEIAKELRDSKRMAPMDQWMVADLELKLKALP